MTDKSDHKTLAFVNFCLQGKALFPHILVKNQDVKVNFGQTEASFHPLPGYQFVGQSTSLVRGTKAPKTKQDCEVIMMCGLPGTGKTSWAYKEFEQNPDKYVGLWVPFRERI